MTLSIDGDASNMEQPKTQRPRRSSTSAGSKSSFYGKPLYRTQSLQKAFEKIRVIKVRFYCNGDQFHQGLGYVVSTARFRTFDALLADLTKRLADKANLPKGVRFVFARDGSHKINHIDQLVEGGSYVCSSFDAYKRVEYGSKSTPDWCVNVRAASSASISIAKQMNRTFQFHENDMRSCTSHESLNKSHHQQQQSIPRYSRDNTTSSHTGSTVSPSSGGGDYTHHHHHRRHRNPSSASVSAKNYIRPRLVFIIRSGVKPRKSIRLLLNKKTCHSLEQVFNDITSAIKLYSGAVRKVYTLGGKQVLSLQDFFLEDEIFIAYGSHEKPSQDDFIVAPQEARTIRPYSAHQPSTNSNNTANGGDPPQPHPRSRRVVLQRKKSKAGGGGNSVSRSNSSSSQCSASGGGGGKKRPVSMPSSSMLLRQQQLQQHKQQQQYLNHKLTTANIANQIQQQQQHQHNDQAGLEDRWPSQVTKLYDIHDVVGDGTYAEVRLCYERLTGNKYALKIVDRSKYVGKESLAANEVNLLRSIRHRNIIRLIRDLQTSHDIYMILEFANGGDLFETISSPSYSFSEHDASLYLYDIVNALAYLHHRSIVHRDVKPENLLISISSNGRRSLKLADFGMATLIKGNELLYTVCGTPTYVAPEIIIHNGYGYPVDVWAAGVITYIMLCGYPPFRSANNNQEMLFDQIIDHQLRFPTSHWNHVSPHAYDVIRTCLCGDPGNRITARRLLEHAWIKSTRNEVRRSATNVAANNSPAAAVTSNSPQQHQQLERNSKKKRVNLNGRTLKDNSATAR